MLDINAGPKAQETVYRGYRFRSRTEARWAVAFDALGLQWRYEPQGYDTPIGYYLPDFFIYSHMDSGGLWVEVKGVGPTDREIAKLAHVCKSTDQPGMLVSGRPEHNEATSWHGINPDGSYYTPESYDVVWAWKYFYADQGQVERGYGDNDPEETEKIWQEAVAAAQTPDLDYASSSMPSWTLNEPLYFLRDDTGIPNTENTLRTKYKDAMFETRLHARWAVLLDSLGLLWAYKPSQYLHANSTTTLRSYRPTFGIMAGAEVFWLDVHDLRPHRAGDSMIEMYNLCQETGFLGGAAWGDPCEWYERCWMGTDAASRNNGHIGMAGQFPWLLAGYKEAVRRDVVSLEGGQLYHHDKLPVWQAAYRAARSARFEHGEVPIHPEWVYRLAATCNATMFSPAGAKISCANEHGNGLHVGVLAKPPHLR